MPKSAPPVRSNTSINIDAMLWRRFKAQCAVSDKTVTEQMERLIQTWLDLHKVATRKATS